MKLLKPPSSLWVAERRGRVVYVRVGKPNAPGIPKAREHKTEEAAQAFLEAERDKRLADGFEMLDETAGLDTPFTKDGKPRQRTVPNKYESLAEVVRMHVRAGLRSREEMEALIEQLAHDRASSARHELATRKQSAMTMEARARDIDIRERVAIAAPTEGDERLVELLTWVESTERSAVRARSRPDPCINERIDAAFAAMNAAGIVALQAAGYTRSDGWGDSLAEADRRRAKGGAPRGACFYHEQDLERGLRGEGLMLAFHVFTGDANVELGREIVRTLREHGVETTWNETAEERIGVPPFVWYRVST